MWRRKSFSTNHLTENEELAIVEIFYLIMTKAADKPIISSISIKLFK